MERRINNWYCVACSYVLGQVLGSEFRPDKSLTGDLLETRGPNLVVKCPECGTKKVWYTADPIVRALYQLSDALATELAGRAIKIISAQTKNIDKLDI